MLGFSDPDESIDLDVKAYDNFVTENKNKKKKIVKTTKLPKRNIQVSKNSEEDLWFFFKGDPLWYIGIKRYKKSRQIGPPKGIKDCQLRDLSNLPREQILVMDLLVAYEDTEHKGRFTTKCVLLGEDKASKIGHEFILQVLCKKKWLCPVNKVLSMKILRKKIN